MCALRDIYARSFRRSPGEEGWLITKEKQYAPQVGILPSMTTKSNKYGYYTHNLGGDKMSNLRNGYATAYSKILAPFLNKPPQVVVELGVFQGASMALWCDLFPDSAVIGLDMDFERYNQNLPKLKDGGGFKKNEPTLINFDAFIPDLSILTSELKGKKIDLFVDDGPHNIEAIEATAKAIKPLMASGSVYVVEDNSSSLDVVREVFDEWTVKRIGDLVVAFEDANG